MARVLMMLAAVLGFTGVAAGAFGAHGLKKYFETQREMGVSADLAGIFETACRYQMYHALALVGLALAWAHWPSRTLEWSGYLMFGGVVVFSGSLYALSLSGITKLGAITPIGGAAMLAGWVLLGVAMLRVAQ